MRKQLWEWLLGHATRGFVVAFHDLEPERMEQLIDALHPTRPIPLDELMQRSKSGRSTAGLCAITVDDGIATTAFAISGVCRKRGWPVTFFLPTGKMNSGEGYAYEWWRNLRPYLSGKKIALASRVMDFTRPEAVGELSAQFEKLWHTAPSDRYLPFTLELVSAVTRDLKISMDAIKPPRTLTWEEVSELSKESWCRFESHGVSHVAVSALGEQEIATELRSSKESISEATGRECRTFCYPFGSPQAIGAAAPKLARSYYDSAVTMSLGHVDFADPWLTPRIPLYPENSAALARTKVVLKCSRLAGGASSRARLQPDLQAKGHSAGS